MTSLEQSMNRTFDGIFLNDLCRAASVNAFPDRRLYPPLITDVKKKLINSPYIIDIDSYKIVVYDEVKYRLNNKTEYVEIVMAMGINGPVVNYDTWQLLEISTIDGITPWLIGSISPQQFRNFGKSNATI